jgi:hypothetical protein
MVVGVNRVFAHEGREYHIQAEDLGLDQACFEARVYDKGSVLWRKRVPYADVVARGLPKAELEEAVRAAMEKTIQTVQAAIAKGKLGAA